jgi:hypothetical protein
MRELGPEGCDAYRDFRFLDTRQVYGTLCDSLLRGSILQGSSPRALAALGFAVHVIRLWLTPLVV